MATKPKKTTPKKAKKPSTSSKKRTTTKKKSEVAPSGYLVAKELSERQEKPRADEMFSMVVESTRDELMSDIFVSKDPFPAGCGACGESYDVLLDWDSGKDVPWDPIPPMEAYEDHECEEWECHSRSLDRPLEDSPKVQYIERMSVMQDPWYEVSLNDLTIFFLKASVAVVPFLAALTGFYAVTKVLYYLVMLPILTLLFGV